MSSWRFDLLRGLGACYDDAGLVMAMQGIPPKAPGRQDEWLHRPALIDAAASSKVGTEKGVAMFQMLNEEMAQPRAHKMKTARVGALTIALLTLGAMVYFYAILPYAHN